VPTACAARPAGAVTHAHQSAVNNADGPPRWSLTPP
jgi:hypothetical protein